jgi:geranylgeranyl diphosphate synthase type II
MMAELMSADISYLERKKTEIDAMLDSYLPHNDRYPHTLHKAMRYSVMAGGKRIRPILAMATYEICDGKDEEIINPVACSLEIVHTYSLIHDDLPCMDDDDFRRGIPTLHREFNEAAAVLAGDALHVLAFQLAARSGSIEVIQELAEAIGTSGMLGGQIADVEAEGKENSLDHIKYIHTHKTGALIRASVRIGAILAGADEDSLKQLSEYGEKIGFAFQIIDDILDIEGCQNKIGKDIGSDYRNRKATYPGVAGLERAHKDADKLIDEAIDIGRNFGNGNNSLTLIARYIGQRDC